MDFIIWMLLGAVGGTVTAHLKTSEWLEAGLVAVIGIVGSVCFGTVGRAAGGLFEEGGALGIVMAVIGAVVCPILYCVFIKPMFPTVGSAPRERP